MNRNFQNSDIQKSENEEEDDEIQSNQSQDLEV